MNGHRIALFLLLLAGCQPTAGTGSPTPATTPAPPPDVAPPPDEAVDDGLTFKGEPVGVTPQELLHQNGEFRVEKQRWRLDDVRGVVWLVSAPREAGVRIVPSKDVVPFVDLLPDAPGPWAAINGGFYEAVPNGPDHRAMGLVVADGTEHSNRTRRGGSGIFYVDADGPHIVHRDEFNAPDAISAVQSIDRIVDNGVSLVSRRPGQSGAMRSAIALSDDRVWLVAAVADADIHRTATSVQLSRSRDGLPLWAFATYLADTVGVNEALNLDGGISTQLAVRDDDYRLDVRGVDGTINAVVLTLRADP